MIYLILFILEIISLCNYSIMYLSGDYGKVIPDLYRKREQLFLIAILLGWILTPYFIWLSVKYIQLTKGEKKDGKKYR